MKEKARATYLLSSLLVSISVMALATIASQAQNPNPAQGPIASPSATPSQPD
jgi:hypothetical protein